MEYRYQIIVAFIIFIGLIIVVSRKKFQNVRKDRIEREHIDQIEQEILKIGMSEKQKAHLKFETLDVEIKNGLKIHLIKIRPKDYNNQENFNDQNKNTDNKKENDIQQYQVKEQDIINEQIRHKNQEKEVNKNQDKNIMNGLNYGESEQNQVKNRVQNNQFFNNTSSSISNKQNENRSILKNDNKNEIQNDNIENNDKRKDKNKRENLVLLHGFLASSILYSKCFSRLSEVYDIYAIDLLGMGLSSRPDFEISSVQECIAFFVDSIELLRQKLGLKKFYLVGHSFGGYIASNYTLRHSEIVQKLFLISPIGIRKRSAQENWQDEKKMIMSANWKNKLYFIFMHIIWKYRILPMQIYQSCNVVGDFLLKKYFQRRFNFGQRERDMWTHLFTYYSYQKISSEKSIYKMFFYPNLTAYCSVQEQIEDLLVNNQDHQIQNIPINFFYGDIDWMPQEGAYNLLNNKKLNVNIYTIQKAGHQVIMDNPEQISNYICSL